MKAEEKPVSEYGEPWKYSDLEGLICIDRENGRPVAMDFDEPDARRAIACVNALAGIPNPEAVRELVEAASEWYGNVCKHGGSVQVPDARLRHAIAALSAPSTGAQQQSKEKP